MPKISIVLPTYNGEKYIRQSIQSIINQTFRDWELIIVLMIKLHILLKNFKIGTIEYM